MCIALVVSVSWSCSDQPEDDGLRAICDELVRQIPVDSPRAIDLLLVVDNSPSMAREAGSMARNLAEFVTVLENIDGGMPDMHIGVISADMGVGPYDVPGCTETGDGGAFLGASDPNCSGPSDGYIVDVADVGGTRLRNYQGSLAETLTCIAPLDADGCEFAQPLDAMRRALDLSNPENAGFLREHALLLVVIISDQDDCSVRDTALFDPLDPLLGPADRFRCFEAGVECSPDQPRTPGLHTGCESREDSTVMRPVQDYVDFAKLLKADPGLVVVSVVSGGADLVEVVTDGMGDLQLAGACDSEWGDAIPDVRLQQFAEQFPQRNYYTSMCEQYLSEALTPVAESLLILRGPVCLEGDIDLDPATDGLQTECSVVQVSPGESGDPVETSLSACSSATPEPGELPCWQIIANPATCTNTFTGATLEVQRNEPASLSNTYLEVTCGIGCSD